jgi:hypothetical protein
MNLRNGFYSLKFMLNSNIHKIMIVTMNSAVKKRPKIESLETAEIFSSDWLCLQ